MDGDGRWRTQCVDSEGDRPYVVWRVIDGATEYHRSEPTNYAPNGRIIRYGYAAGLAKARELNGLT